MPPKTTLNAKNLEALGAERLASLLIEVSAGDAAAKRKLRMALVGLRAPGEVSREIRKRLTAVANARSRVGWRSRKALVADLDGLRRAIADQVAGTDPVEALDLMWRFLELADRVFARCDDRTGTVMAVFEAGVADLAKLAAAAKADPVALAERACRALRDNGYGQYDGLIVALAPVLGTGGLDHLKALLLDLAKTPPPKPPQKERVIFGWSTAGPIYVDDVERSARARAVSLALEAIADLQGDVDAFIAQQSGKARTVPAVAAEIARRLLAAGRAVERGRFEDLARAAGARRRGCGCRQFGQAGLDPAGMGRGASGHAGGARPSRRGAGVPLVLLRAEPGARSPARLPEAAAGFRRYGGRGAGDGACRGLPRGASGARLLPGVAGTGQGRASGDGPRRRDRRRPLRDPDAGRRGAGGGPPDGGDDPAARDDRLHARPRPVEPLPPCGAASRGVRRAGGESRSPRTSGRMTPMWPASGRRTGGRAASGGASPDQTRKRPAG